VISDDELAAITAALTALTSFEAPLQGAPQDDRKAVSRWKFAARNPDLELEDYRSV
jgi:hypothetical protein